MPSQSQVFLWKLHLPRKYNRQWQILQRWVKPGGIISLWSSSLIIASEASSERTRERAAFPTPPLALASPFARDSRDSPKWTAYWQARYPVRIVSTVTVISYKRLTPFKRNDRLVSIFALLAPSQATSRLCRSPLEYRAVFLFLSFDLRPV